MGRKGYKFREETKEKIRQALKGNRNKLGYKLAEETKRKISASLKGVHHSKESYKRQGETLKKTMSNPELRKRMSEAQKKRFEKEIPWNKGKKLGFIPRGAFKKGSIPWIKGRHHSVETLKKLSEAHKGKPTPWMIGRHPSEESRKRMSEGQKKRFSNLEERRRQSARVKKIMSNPEKRKILSEGQKRMWSRPEERKKMLENMPQIFKKGGISLNKGKHPSEETIRKQKESFRKTWESNPEVRKRMSEAQKRRFSNPEELKKLLAHRITTGHLGKPHSAEARMKMSLALKGKVPWIKGKKHTPEELFKMGLAHIGQTPWNKGKKMSLIREGFVSPMKGKHWPEEVRKRMSIARELGIQEGRVNIWNKGKKGVMPPPWNKGLIGYNTGEKSPSWRGGISFEPYSLDWTKALKKAIKERDNNTCQLCFKKGILVHHIDYNKKNCNSENLITLCRSCHSKTNAYREKWKQLFNEKKKV